MGKVSSMAPKDTTPFRARSEKHSESSATHLRQRGAHHTSKIQSGALAPGRLKPSPRIGCGCWQATRAATPAAAAAASTATAAVGRLASGAANSGKNVYDERLTATHLTQTAWHPA